ncbi:MAG: NUDIX hydrolase [Candidatus Aenigmatarchaeota archaeon]
MREAGYVDVVDESDKAIGKLHWTEADKDDPKRITRAAAVLVFNSKSGLFLQKRSKNKRRFPLHWAESASRWVDAGETYVEAAAREIEEEIGIKRRPDELEFLFRFFADFDRKEFVEVYRTVSDGPVKLNPEEVAEGRFFSMGEIRRMIEGGEKFSPFSLSIFGEFLQKADRN